MHIGRLVNFSVGAFLLMLVLESHGLTFPQCNVWCGRFQRCYSYAVSCRRAYERCQCQRTVSKAPPTPSPVSPGNDVRPSGGGGGEPDSKCGQWGAGGGAGLLRIVGGKDAPDCQFPATVVVRRGHAQCGGALIDDQHVLTAAHCITDEQGRVTSPNTLRVGYGSSHFQSLSYVTVTEVIRYPQYSTKKKDHDLALLRLSRRLPLGRCVQPLCVPRASMAFSPGQDCLVSGWGLLSEGGSGMPDRLQMATVPIISPASCRRAYAGYYDDDKICAGFMAGGVDACQGDSGGPLMCVDGNTWYVAGIVSLGYGCARKNSPGVYSYVPAHASWIADVTKS